MFHFFAIFENQTAWDAVFWEETKTL